MKTLFPLFAALAFSFVTMAHANVTETFKQTYPLTADGILSLDGVSGVIEIVAWEKDEVSLEAVKDARDADELQRLKIVVNSKCSRLVIKTDYEKKSGWSFLGNWNQGDVRYKLMVPAGVRLEKISSVNSDISVTGVHGPVNLSTVNGSIKASGLMADATLNSVNGSLSAGFDALDKIGFIKLESVNGRAEVTLPKGASASISTQSVIGSTEVEQAIKLNKSGHLGLSGQIGSGGPAITLKTVNGGIAVREK